MRILSTGAYSCNIMVRYSCVGTDYIEALFMEILSHVCSYLRTKDTVSNRPIIRTPMPTTNAKCLEH